METVRSAIGFAGKWRPGFSLASLTLFVLFIASSTTLVLHWNPWSYDRLAKHEEARGILYNPPGLGQLGSIIGCGHASKVFINLEYRTLEYQSEDALTILTINVGDFRYSMDGQRLAERRDHTVYIWDTVHGTVVTSFEVPPQYACRGSFSWDNARYAIPHSEDERIAIWDANQGHLLCTFAAKNGVVAFSPDGRFLYTGHPGSERASVYRLRRPEPWWGILILPELWITVVSSVALIWSIARDRCSLTKGYVESLKPSIPQFARGAI